MVNEVSRQSHESFKNTDFSKILQEYSQSVTKEIVENFPNIWNKEKEAEYKNLMVKILALEKSKNGKTPKEKESIDEKIAKGGTFILKISGLTIPDNFEGKISIKDINSKDESCKIEITYAGKEKSKGTHTYFFQPNTKTLQRINNAK